MVYRAPISPFAPAEGGATALIPVTLPHDELRDAERTLDTPSSGAYYPRGALVT
jgi:beta-galactosidase